jgi:hypothetical protein
MEPPKQIKKGEPKAGTQCLLSPKTRHDAKRGVINKHSELPIFRGCEAKGAIRTCLPKNRRAERAALAKERGGHLNGPKN